MYQYRVSDKTVSKFIPEVADAIFNVLKDEYLKFLNLSKNGLKYREGFTTNGNSLIVYVLWMISIYSSNVQKEMDQRS